MYFFYDKFQTKKFLAKVFFLFFITHGSFLSAVNYTFLPASGNWSVGANWTPAGGPPTAADNATVNNGRIAAVNSADFANIILVGSAGNGTINVTSGGTLTSSNLNLSLGSAVTGTLNVSGSTAVVNNTVGTGIFNVGAVGAGIANISSGGHVNAVTTTIAATTTISSSVNVSDAGSSFINTGALTIGSNGIGTFQVLNGAVATNTSATLGLNNVSLGNIANVSGTGSIWTSTGNLTIGSSGSGTVNVQNGGQVTALGVVINANNVVGSSGTLNLLSTGNLTTGFVSGGAGPNSNLTFNGGSITASGNSASFISGITAGNATFAAGGGTINTQNFTVTIPQSFTGAGALTKTGNGTLILTGANTLSGSTTISAGTLQGAVANLPSGNVTNSGQLIFDQGVAATFASNITGTGSVTKQNVGTLTLLGANTYTGGTSITAGTLQGNTTSLQGSIVDQANLIFDQTFDGTYSGALSGTGTFVKQGAALLQMTGNSSAFSGTSTIATGHFKMNGILGGILTVNSGAVLSGTGFLNTVINNGTIAPGNSIGTLHVTNFINGPTGIYQVEINSVGASTQIDATGTATLNGGALVVTADPGIYLKGTTYTIINAQGGLTGQFTSHLLPTNVQLGVLYLPQQLLLTVLETTLDTAGLRGNALRVARYIRDNVVAGEDFLNIIAALNALDPADEQKALDQLHPALFEALPITVGDTTHMINTIFTDRLRYIRQNNRCACACETQNMSCGGAWVAGTADFVRQNRTDGLRRFNTGSEGAAVGFDRKLNDSLLAGVGLGYSHTNLHWGNSCGRTAINGFYVGGYATQSRDCFYIEGTVLAFVNHHRVRRHIHFADIDRNAKNNHYSYGFNPHLGAGAFLNLCAIDIIPYFDLDYYLVQQNRAREHGASSLNLHVKRNQTNLLRLETGFQFTKCIDLCGGRLIPNASISYVAHRILSGNKYISAFENIAANFAVFGTKRCFNQLELGAGLQYLVNERWGINTWYDIELGHKRQEQEVNLEINYNF